MPNNIAIIGSSGTIGTAFVQALSSKYPDATIHALSRQQQSTSTNNVINIQLDYLDETSLKEAASQASVSIPLDLVIVAVGILHSDGIMPEKSLRDVTADKFMQLYQINTVVPALIAKHFVPVLNKKQRSVFAVLSARVGSISDNRLGGWYAYRASKAALNMIVKNVAIETLRTNRQAIVCALHPGTVDSPLSEPFQKNVPKDKLFTADYSVACMLQVLDSMTDSDSGKIFAWDGKEVAP